MPHLPLPNDKKMYYAVYGEGPETILFAHGLLWDHREWDAQVDHFKNKYRVVVFDHHGQGLSARTKTGHDMDSLADDAIALIEHLAVGKVHWVGLSMGGFVGIRVAAKRPDLVKTLSLLNTTSLPESPAKIREYGLLVLVVKILGIKLVANQVLPLMFGKTFMKNPARKSELAQIKAEMLKHHKSIVLPVQGVMHRPDFTAQLHNISAPTLVLTGDEDLAIPAHKSKKMAEHIQGALFEEMKGVGHMSNIECPDLINQRLENFIGKGV